MTTVHVVNFDTVAPGPDGRPTLDLNETGPWPTACGITVDQLPGAGTPPCKSCDYAFDLFGSAVIWASHEAALEAALGHRL